MSTFFRFILDFLSDIICLVVLKVLSDSAEDAGMHKYLLHNAGMHKYFLHNSGKELNSTLT